MYTCSRPAWGWRNRRPEKESCEQELALGSVRSSRRAKMAFFSDALSNDAATAAAKARSAQQRSDTNRRRALTLRALLHGHSGTSALSFALSHVGDRELLQAACVSKTFKAVVDGTPDLSTRAATARTASKRRMKERREQEQRLKDLRPLERAICDRSLQAMMRGSCDGCLDLLPERNRSEGWDLCVKCYKGKPGGGKEYSNFCQICYRADELDSEVLEGMRNQLAAREIAASESEYGFEPTFNFSLPSRQFDLEAMAMAAMFM